MHKETINEDILTLLEKGRFDSYGISFGDGEGGGWGDGYGSDNGNGNGWGGGYGNGFSPGFTDGFGDGNSTGCGDGCGDGYGCNDVGWGITEINGMKVYGVDCMPTAIETVFGAYAKGYTVKCDFTFEPCYVAMDGFSLAHGKTLKEAFRDARAKETEKLPEDERAKRFIMEHPDPEENLPNEEFFILHHTLTGSCKFGRKEFCEANRIDLEASMSISEFLTLTENEYGGSVIKKIKKEYLYQAETGVPETPVFIS